MDATGERNCWRGVPSSRQDAGRKWRVALDWEHGLSIVTDGKVGGQLAVREGGVGVLRGGRPGGRLRAGTVNGRGNCSGTVGGPRARLRPVVTAWLRTFSPACSAVHGVAGGRWHPS